MKEYILLEKIHMDCPLCDKVHDVEKRKHIASTVIKGEEVSYEEIFYFCPNVDEEENEFVTGTILNKNLLNARNAYRIKKGLLTSDDIVSIRENYGLSQVDLARLLGWGEATISRYESKAIQDEAYDTILRLIKDNPLRALELLKKNMDKFTASKFFEIKSKIVEKLDAYGKEFLTRQTLESEYVNFDEPVDFNGFTILNIDKVEVIVSYFAENISNLFKVKLMKMLWYADALYFKRYGRTLTGMVYTHEPMGALPIGHYSLMNLENINVQEEVNANYNVMLHVYPKADIDYSVLDKKEMDVLDMVIRQFSNYRAKDIIAYMHEERAYMETNPGEIIPFSLAKEIRDFE